MQKMSLKRLYGNFKNALSGFNAVYQTQCAFRTEICFCVPLLLIALLMPVSLIEKVLLIYPVFFVWACELANTALETTVDRISKEWHPLSKRAKDIGSALVLTAFIQLILSWALILGHIFV